MKRGRSAEQDRGVTLTERAQSHDGASLVEEIVTVEETRSILVRFPCLDFFRDAHMCEVATPQSGDSTSSREGEGQTAAQFFPDALTFKPGTLETSRPVVLLRTAELGEVEFEGSWQDSAETTLFTAPLSNRVVVQLCEKGDDRAAKNHHHKSHHRGDGAGTGSESRFGDDTTRTAPGVEVASLLKHPSVGITADEARRRQKAHSASWAYSRIDVPCATLVLRRVK